VEVRGKHITRATKFVKKLAKQKSDYNQWGKRGGKISGTRKDFGGFSEEGGVHPENAHLVEPS